MTSAEASLVKLGPASFAAGSDGTYTLQMHNAGPSVAAGPLTITDSLPAGESFVSASGAGRSGQPTVPPTPDNSPATPVNPSNITCTNPQDLAVGATAPTLSLTVLVGANVTGSLLNTASAASQTEDPDPANNTASTPPVPVIILVAEVEQPSTAPPPSSGILPFTGQPILRSLVAGLILSVAGLGFLLAARRRGHRTHRG